MSKITVWMVLHKCLVFKPYRVQMVQQLHDEGTALISVYSYKT